MELRLGLPGSESPNRVIGSGLTLWICVKGFGPGSKRGFSDAIDRSPKWVFNRSDGPKYEFFSLKSGESDVAAVKDGDEKQ